MVSSFDENELLLYEFKTNNENYEKLLDNEINIIVNYNTIGENQEIIVHYIGDVYDAIKLLNKKINKMDIDKYDNKDLAYISSTINDLKNIIIIINKNG
jgi:chlorite dismutase